MSKEILVVADGGEIPGVILEVLRAAFKGCKVICARRNPGEVRHPYAAIIAVNGARIRPPSATHVLNLQLNHERPWRHPKIHLHSGGQKVCSFELDASPSKVKWESTTIRQALAA